MAAEPKPKNLDAIHLESRANDLRKILETLPESSPIHARKKASLAAVEAELAALATKK